MEDSSKTLTPAESLDIIKGFILNYRRNFKYNSYYFLLWGWLISLACISHFAILTYLQHTGNYGKIGLWSWVNWLAFPLLGIMFTIIHANKGNHSPESRGHIGRIITSLWQVTGVAIFLVLALCIKLGNYYPGPYILTVVGLSTMVTGITIKFRPVILGGVGFFIFAVLSSFFANDYQLLINALAIIMGYLIPGYMLRSYKPEENV